MRAHSSGRRRFWKPSLCALAAAIGAALTSVTADEPAANSQKNHAALNSLFTHWQARQGDIATAHITYRSFHNAVEGKRSLRELEGFLAAGLLSSTPDQVREFIAAMNGAPYHLDPPWGLGTIIVSDARRRNDLGPFTSIEDREICVDYDSLNTQFDVASAGGSRRRSDDLHMFRPSPPEPWTPDRWQVVDQQPASIILKRVLSPQTSGAPRLDKRTYEFDPDTGLLTKIVRTNDRGEILSTAHYLEPVDLAGGITFPRVFVEAVFKQGVATVLHVCAIDTITVNESIADSAFHLPAIQNSRIVDHRGSKKLVSRLDRQQADIVAWLKDHSPVLAQLPTRPEPADDTLRNVLLTGNGLLLIVIGLAIWRRQRAPHSNRTSDAVAPNANVTLPGASR